MSILEFVLLNLLGVAVGFISGFSAKRLLKYIEKKKYKNWEETSVLVHQDEATRESSRDRESHSGGENPPSSCLVTKAKRKYYLRCVFHGFGIGVIVTSVLNQFLIFLDILRFGGTILMEPNIYILSTEIIMYGLGLAYVVWFFKRYIIQRKILEETKG
jgi:hypothetical protein